MQLRGLVTTATIRHCLHWLICQQSDTQIDSTSCRTNLWIRQQNFVADTHKKNTLNSVVMAIILFISTTCRWLKKFLWPTWLVGRWPSVPSWRRLTSISAGVWGIFVYNSESRMCCSRIFDIKFKLDTGL